MWLSILSGKQFCEIIVGVLFRRGLRPVVGLGFSTLMLMSMIVHGIFGSQWPPCCSWNSGCGQLPSRSCCGAAAGKMQPICSRDRNTKGPVCWPVCRPSVAAAAAVVVVPDRPMRPWDGQSTAADRTAADALPGDGGISTTAIRKRLQWK